MKSLILILLLTTLCALITAKALSEVEPAPEGNEETQSVDLLTRITRQATAAPTCKYQKGPWSACDKQTKKRTRTFSLKKGPRGVCEEVKLLTKDCKKRQKQKNNSKNRDRQRQNKKQENSKNKQN